MTAPSEDIPMTATATVEDIPATKPPADPGTPRLAVENLRIVMRPSRGRPEVDVVDQVSFTVMLDDVVDAEKALVMLRRYSPMRDTTTPSTLTKPALDSE